MPLTSALFKDQLYIFHFVLNLSVQVSCISLRINSHVSYFSPQQWGCLDFRYMFSILRFCGWLHGDLSMYFSFFKEKELNTEVFFVYATCMIWRNQIWQEERQHIAVRIIVGTNTCTQTMQYEDHTPRPHSMHICSPQINECLICSYCEKYCILMSRMFF